MSDRKNPNRLGNLHNE
ncbi:hypothetical protein VCHENC02_2566A, partial [Vibrio harveyi]